MTTPDSVKLCVIGDSGVGKTCISGRLSEGQYKEEKPTIGASFVTTFLPINGNSVKVVIWDTAGQEKYRSMVGMYYRGASGAIIVYDITNKNSFSSISSWYSDLMKTCSTDISLAIVGNKCDLEEARQVTVAEGQELANSYNALFFEVSALNGNNITELFTEVTKKVKIISNNNVIGGDNVSVKVENEKKEKKKFFC